MLLPKNSKDAKGARDFFTTLRTQTASLANAFGEPLKALADEFTAKLDKVIAGLPAGDPPGDWSLENQLENLFACFAGCSAIASQASLELSKLKSDMVTQASQVASKVSSEIESQVQAGTLFKKDALPGQVEAAVKTKLDAGELILKATVTQLCSAARAEGVTEGETKVRGQLDADRKKRELIDTRRTALQTAGLPMPEAELVESILGAADADFNAAKAKFETRQEKLKKEGFSLNSELLPNLWGDDASFTRFEKTIAGIPALKVVAEPLLGNPGNVKEGEKKPKGPVFAV